MTVTGASGWRPWALRLGLLIGASLVTAEVAGRVLLMVRYEATLRRPSDVLRRYYPELHRLRQEPVQRGGKATEVLLLGGSVLHPAWGKIPGALKEVLREELGKPVRVHILATPGHTSADSRKKYQGLADSRFDLVLMYHGINDVRANNCPAEMFRPDYTHLRWYKQVALVERYSGPLAIPLAAGLCWQALGVRAGWVHFQPRVTLDEEWTRHGAELKTPPVFAAHVASIAELARQRGDPLVVPTFVSYVPADYDADRFAAKELDYGAHRSAVEIWGQRAHVEACIAAHNQHIRDLARAPAPLRVVDMEGAVPHSAANFDDCCHLTTAGSQAFVAALRPALLDALASAGAEAEREGGP